MSYGRDKDAHHRGVGAIAAADHLKMRGRKRAIIARGTARRDRQLAGLTYGLTGGLSGFGHLEPLGAINLRNVGVRTPTVNYGGGVPEGNPMANPYGRPQLGPNLGGRLPPLAPSATPVPPLTVRSPFGPRLPGVLTTAPGPIPGGGGVFCSRADALAGRCGQQGGGTSSDPTGGGTSTDPGSGSTSSSGSSSGSSGGGGAGIDSGGSGVTLPPAPDVPDLPDGTSTSASSDSVTIAGYAVPKRALLIGGAVGLFLLLRRRR